MPFPRPVNDHEILAELDRRCLGYGNGVQTARELGIEPSHLREMKSGRRKPSAKVADGLGYELCWIKKETK